MTTPRRNRTATSVLIATTALVVSAGAGMAQSFNSTDTPLRVPLTGSSGNLTSTIAVPAIGTIDDVNLSFNLSHTYGGDLLIRLTAPSGTNFVAVNNEYTGGGCGSSADFGGSYTFDDEAGAGFSFTPGTYTVGANGSGSMADFEGENAGGDWDLFIDDQCGGDIGTLSSWGLAFVVAAGPGGGGAALGDFAAAASTAGRFVALNARELSRFRGRDSLATRDEILSFTRVADPETGGITVTQSTMDSAQMLGDIYAWIDVAGFRAEDGGTNRSYSGHGLQIGADMALSPDMVVGLSFGVQDLDASIGTVGQDGVLRYLQPYMAYRAGAWSGEASLIHGWGDYTQTSVGGTGTGETRLTAITFDGGYDIALDQGVTVTPMLGLAHGVERIEGIGGTLAGAGTETVHFTQVSLGGEISHATGSGEIFAGLHADWLDTDAETALVSGLLIDDGWTGRLELGVSGDLGNGIGFSTSVELSGLGGDLQGTSGALRFSFRF